MINVVIVDRVRLIGEVIVAAFEEETDIAIAKIVGSKDEALSLLQSDNVPLDVLLVSTTLPSTHALDVVKSCRQHRPATRVLVMGMPETDPMILTYIEAAQRAMC